MQPTDPSQIDIDQLVENLQAAQAKIENLETALKSARAIGMAVGIVMTTYKVTDSQAFDMLVVVSQGTSRKLREIADDVVHTGVLDLSGWPGRRSREVA